MRLINPLHLVAQRLSGRGDTEHAQAIIRIVISAVITVYLNSGAGNSVRGPLSAYGDEIPIFYTCASIGIFVWILIDPRVSIFRRYFAMVMDFSLESLCIVLEGERAAPMFLVYVWVSLGNGFRFGVRSLLWSTLVSSVAFACVIVFSPFYQSIMYVSVGMGLTLIAIPCYAASLIHQLHAAKTVAEQANYIKSRFLATVSHELRTPLHAIIGLSDLLQHTKLTSEQQEMIQTVRGSGGALLSLVEDVLDISSIQAGRMVTEITDFDLCRNLAETVAIASTQAARKQLDLGLHIDADVPRMMNGDWKHTRQILLNLLTNAIKFTDEGGVQLNVSMAGPPELLMVRFEIRDSGIGVSAEDQSRIFESFAQVNESATRTHGGVGLGLSIVRQLTDLLKGRIDLSSEIGKGSVFGVTLPFHSAVSRERVKENYRVLVKSEDPAIARVLHAYFPDLLSATDYRDLKNAEDDSGAICVLIDTRECEAAALEDSMQEVRDRLAGYRLAFVRISECPMASEVSSHFATSLALPIDPRKLEAALSIGSALASHTGQPVADVPWTPEAQVANDVEAPSPIVEDRNCRILVVDDSPVNRMVSYKILASAGYTVTLAEDGPSALELLADEDYEIVMLDINMPGASGIDIIKLYQVMRLGLPMPKIVVFSAEVTEDTRQECVELGVALFLPKPCEPAVMLDRMAELAPEYQADANSEPETAKISYIEAHPRYVASAEMNVIDRSIVQSLLELDGGPTFLQQLVGEFQRDTVTVLAAIDRAVHARAMNEFWDQVHAMRSSAANVGAKQLFAACLDMNAQGHVSFNMRGSEYAARLRYEFTRYQRAITRLLNTQVRSRA